MSFSMVTASTNNAVRTPPRAVASPPENVTADFAMTQVVTLGQPYNTPKAANIRAFCAARLLNNDNQRLFLFRKETGNTWTNIALDSTPSVPKLTAPPAEIARKLSTILVSCPDVNQVIMRGPDGERVTAEDVSNMQFTPLEEQAVAPPVEEVAAPPADTNAMMRQIKDVDTKVDDLAFMLKADMVELKASLDAKFDWVVKELDRKLTHIIDVLYKTVEHPPPVASDVETVEQPDASEVLTQTVEKPVPSEGAGSSSTSSAHIEVVNESELGEDATVGRRKHRKRV